MSIVPKEVNITIVTLSSTLDDICSAQCSGALSWRLYAVEQARSDRLEPPRPFAAYHRYNEGA